MQDAAIWWLSVAKSLLPDFVWLQSKNCQGVEAPEGPGDLS
jgi:hypothetical protein